MKYRITIVLMLSAVCVTAQTEFNTILTKTEKEVIPEGIAINPTTGTIYVSSIGLQKIIAIDANGAHQDFIKPNQDEFLEGLGMKVDAKKQWLWVVSNQKQGDWYVSQVHAFDLKTSSVRQKYLLKDTIRHLFNDLIVHPNGKIYITDTYGSSVYEADPAKQKLNLFIRDSLVAWPNGITFNAKGKVYIATYSHGLVQLDLVSKKLSALNGFTDSTKAYNLDGLVFWNNSIIGVYNTAKENNENAVVQYNLTDAGDRIVSEKIIDKGNPSFHEPTTAAVLGNRLYVLANSYLAAYNANKESVKGIEDKLGSVVILVYGLR